MGWCWLYALVAYSQSMQVQRITVKDGLSQSSPYHIFKDSRGFLWLGTLDGVNRFDGNRFRIYKPDAGNKYSFHGVNVSGIVEDKNGDIWIGSEEGLNRYDRKSDRFFLVRTSRQKKRTSPFYADEKELWFSQEGDGIMAYEFKTNRLRRIGSYAYLSRDFDYVDWTTRSPFGDVWMLAPKGVVRFDIRSKTYHYYFNNSSRNEYGQPLNVYSLIVDKHNVAWLGTDHGLVRFDHQRKKHEVFEWASEEEQLGVVFSISEDHNDQLWLGTQRNGLWTYDKSTKRFKEFQYRPNLPESLRKFEFYRVYVDNTGIIWANSDPDGLLKIVPNASMFGYLGQSNPGQPQRNLSDPSVRSIGEDGHGRIWIGTEGGLDIFDRKSGLIRERYFTNDHNILKYIFRDSKQRMWIGTYGGIMQFDEETKQFKKHLFDSDSSSRTYVRNIVELPNKKFLIGTPLGMWLFDPVTEAYERVPLLKDRNIFATYLDRQGTLWLSSYFEGLYGYRISKGKWQKVYEGLHDFNINAIQEDARNNVLWIATEKGLVAFDKSKKDYRLYSEKDGLANTYIYGLLVCDDNQIFLSTNHGISSLDIPTGVFCNYNLSDGLQGYEYNGNAFMMSSRNECYFGGVNGVNYFYPSQFRKLSYRPHVYFHNFRVNEEPFEANGYINEKNIIYLQHDQNTFSLEFASIDYYSNGRNFYQYYLENQDEGWVNAGDRNYVRYANLSPGRYLLRVKAANRDRVWNGQERQLLIVIKPPFWRTWWFSAFYLLLVGGGTYLIVQGRLRHLNRQQQERLKIVLEAQEQERKNIAQDLHDEVGSRLATLKLYLSSLTNFLKDNTEAQRIKQEAFDIITISMIDIRRLLRELNPKTLEQYGYAAAVEELIGKINASDQVRVSFECRNLPEDLPKDMQMGLYRITQELLNNTLKHANATEVVISVVPSGSTISFFYSDNGKGFDFAKASKGLGLGNIESRVTVLGGKIAWFSSPGSGLEVTIEIPNVPIRRGAALNGEERVPGTP